MKMTSLRPVHIIVIAPARTGSKGKSSVSNRSTAHAKKEFVAFEFKTCLLDLLK